MNPVVRTLSAPELTEIALALLRSTGIPDDHARITADILVTTNLRGTDSHGVRLLPFNVRRLLGGGIKTHPDVRPVVQAGSIEIWEGDFGLGMVCGTLSMERAVDLAKDHGIGWVTTRHSNHYGASGTFAMLAVDKGFVGVSMSNSGPCMAVHGAAVRSIGNNPMAIGAPGPDFPVVLDMAMSVSSGGRIGAMRRRGEPVPEEWLVRGPDPGARPAMRPFAGPKGSGLAVMVEVLTGVLSGGGILSDLCVGGGFSPTQPDNCSLTHIAIDAKALVPPDQYDEAMRRLVAQLKGVRRAPGVDEIRLPGERAWRESERRRKEGIPLDQHTFEALEELAEEVGVRLDWP